MKQGFTIKSQILFLLQDNLHALLPLKMCHFEYNSFQAINCIGCDYKTE